MALDCRLEELKPFLLNDLPECLDAECPVCLTVLTDEPHLAECCGRHFCGPCVLKIRSSQSCPMCNSTGSKFKLVRDKSTDRILGSQRMYCFNSTTDPAEVGCEWTGELRYLCDHLDKDCLYQEVSCPHKGCKKEIMRCDLEKHIKKNCRQRPYQCKYCGVEGTYTTIRERHYNQCPYYPVPCPLGCRNNVQRYQLDNHLETKCPLQRVDCEYSWLGCKERPLRKDAEKHYSHTLGHHGVLLARAHRQLAEEFGQVNTATDRFFSQVSCTFTEHQAELKEVQNDLKAKHQALCEKHNQLMAMHQVLHNKHDDLMTKHQTLCNKHDCLMVKHDRLNDAHVKLENKHSALEKKHENLENNYTTLKCSHKFQYCVTVVIGLMSSSALLVVFCYYFYAIIIIIIVVALVLHLFLPYKEIF